MFFVSFWLLYKMFPSILILFFTLALAIDFFVENVRKNIWLWNVLIMCRRLIYVIFIIQFLDSYLAWQVSSIILRNGKNNS